MNDKANILETKTPVAPPALTFAEALKRATDFAIARRGTSVRFGVEGSIFVLDANNKVFRQYTRETETVYRESTDNRGIIIHRELLKEA